MTIISGIPVSFDPILLDWQSSAVSTIRFLIGDFDPDQYKYTEQRLLSLFMISSNLVLLDCDFDSKYTIDMSISSILPNPLEDINFMGLVSLRAACVLLNSELRSKAINRVTMKDGPSEITMDNSSSMTSLKDLASSICKKYEDSLFQFRAGNSIGVAISGPYSPGSVSAGRNTESDNSRNTY